MLVTNNTKPTSSPGLPQDQTSAGSCQWIPWTSPPISGWGRCSSPPPSGQTLCSSPPHHGPSSSPCPHVPAGGTSSPGYKEREQQMSLISSLPSLPFTQQSKRDPGRVTYVNEADVEFLGCVSSLQVASDVNIIVTDDACDDVRGGDALCPLGRGKHTCHGWRYRRLSAQVMMLYTFIDPQAALIFQSMNETAGSSYCMTYFKLQQGVISGSSGSVTVWTVSLSFVACHTSIIGYLGTHLHP